jgi:hypothetical protein
MLKAENLSRSKIQTLCQDFAGVPYTAELFRYTNVKWTPGGEGGWYGLTNNVTKK